MLGDRSTEAGWGPGQGADGLKGPEWWADPVPAGSGESHVAVSW